MNVTGPKTKSFGAKHGSSLLLGVQGRRRLIWVTGKLRSVYGGGGGGVVSVLINSV